MSGMRQKIQYSLALEPVDQGETPVSGYQGTEPLVAKPTSESPASAEQLMKEVCDREESRKSVETRSKQPGQSWRYGMTIDDAKDHLREHWPSIRSQLLEEPTSRNRSSGSKYPNRTVGSENSACRASSTD